MPWSSAHWPPSELTKNPPGCKQRPWHDNRRSDSRTGHAQGFVSIVDGTKFHIRGMGATGDHVQGLREKYPRCPSCGHNETARHSKNSDLQRLRFSALPRHYGTRPHTILKAPFSRSLGERPSAFCRPILPPAARPPALQLYATI